MPPVAGWSMTMSSPSKAKDGSMCGSRSVSDSACTAASALGHPAGEGELGVAVAGADPPPGEAVFERALGCKDQRGACYPRAAWWGRRRRASGRPSWPRSGCGWRCGGSAGEEATFSPASSGAPSGPLMKACIQIRYGLPCLSCRRRQWPRTYLQISMIVLLFTHVRTVAYSSATEMAPCVVVPCG